MSFPHMHFTTIFQVFPVGRQYECVGNTVKLWNILQMKITFCFQSDTFSTYQVLNVQCDILKSDSMTPRLLLGYLKTVTKFQVPAPKKTSRAL